ncbi:MAG TPA: hypothetical protein VMS60_02365 [Solirubrobacterales bacterium]|nr:hypothetical protein [Solirubrobacterales bacterium]
MLHVSLSNPAVTAAALHGSKIDPVLGRHAFRDGGGERRSVGRTGNEAEQGCGGCLGIESAVLVSSGGCALGQPSVWGRWL